jgi:twitching motility protein PilT
MPGRLTAGTFASRAVPAQPPSAPPPHDGSKRVIDTLLNAMIELKASDLHVSSECPPMVRKDGSMVEVPGWPALSASEVKNLLWEITPERNKEQFGECCDTDYAYEITGLARFRVNIFMDRKGVGAVFRVIPSKIITAEDLNLSKEILALCNLPKGLVLVTGPTGSGKSTTLCALIDYINRTRKDHIITIEDPIEFVHENKNCLINQREIHEHTKSFKSALRAALREDPDIVYIGEMRDLETIAIAIETAETGHLVFGTLHTSTAPSTIDRIIDQFPGDKQEQIRTMLSESLRGVICQMLCKKIGGGRTAAMEVLIVTHSVSNLIRERKTFQIQSVLQTGRNLGMCTMNDSFLDLVRQKKVAPEEAYDKAIDKTGLLGMYQKNGIDTSWLR